LLTAYGIAGAFMALNLSGSALFMKGVKTTTWGWAPVPGILYNVFILAFYTFFVMGLVHLGRAYRRTASSFRRNRAMLILIGTRLRPRGQERALDRHSARSHRHRAHGPARPGHRGPRAAPDVQPPARIPRHADRAQHADGTHPRHGRADARARPRRAARRAAHPLRAAAGGRRPPLRGGPGRGRHRAGAEGLPRPRQQPAARVAAADGRRPGEGR